MNKITEVIVEPSQVYVGSTFLVKVRVKDALTTKKLLVTEKGKLIITENSNPLRSEWGG
ncbi:MAG: hypothetical protein UIM53_01130 [Acutalibacteraceae bacterium]|nr:hypothetical protein [Acutalibacteraceae bacterium]